MAEGSPGGIGAVVEELAGELVGAAVNAVSRAKQIENE